MPEHMGGGGGGGGWLSHSDIRLCLLVALVAIPSIIALATVMDNQR